MKRSGWMGNVVLASSVVVLVWGCGGGTKTSNNAGGPNAPGNGTTDSAVTVVRTASDQMMTTHMVADLGAERGRAALGAQLASADTDPTAGAMVLELIGQLLDRSDLTPVAQATTPRAVVQLPAAACSNGGTVSASLDDIDNSTTVTSGDTVTFTLANCAGRMATASGTIVISNIVIGGTPAPNSPVPWNISGNFTYTNLSVVDPMLGAGTVIVNGNVNATWQNTNATQSSGTLTIPNLTMNRNGAVTTYTNLNMNSSIDRSTTPPTVSMTMTGSLTDPTLGVLNIQTTSPLVRQGGPDSHPTAGAMTITKGDGSRVVATTLSGTTVQLQTFPAGSTTPSSTSTTSWETIHSTAGMNMPR